MTSPDLIDELKASRPAAPAALRARVRAISAQENFDKVMYQVNNWIMDGMKKGATSSIITLG